MSKRLVGSYTMPTALKKELVREFKESDGVAQAAEDDRHSEYHNKRFKRGEELTQNLTYKQRMEQRELEREELRVKQEVKQLEEKKVHAIGPRVRKKRWDVTPEQYEQALQKVPVINGIPLTDAVLDKILPRTYRVAPVPLGYKPLGGAPEVSGPSHSFYVPPEAVGTTVIPASNDIEGVELKEADLKYFGKLTKVSEDSKQLTLEERNEIKVMKLLLGVKNGTPATRKRALRQLTDSSRTFGPKVLFDQILPVLLEPSLDLQERHLLVKTIGRILFQLADLVRPFTHKILLVIAPLLIDENYTLRLEAREIVANLAKAADMSTMISTLRPDLDHVDEYVRNILSRVFAIVANTLGLVSFMPFLRAVIKSKKNWMARHTGIKIVQQLCVLLGGGNGNSILPYLPQLVDVIQPALSDEMLQVRTIGANTLAQLADSVRPYGAESFEGVMEPAWVGLKKHRGKGLASFMKCIGAIVPLMAHDPNYEEYSNFYTLDLMKTVKREFQTPDVEMKKAILRVMVDLPLTPKLFPHYNKEIVQPFFQAFWNRRTASDSQQLGRLVVAATAQLATQFEFLDILEHIVYFSKDENENLRRLSLEAIHRMMSSGSDNLIGIDSQLETRLVDGILFAFQEQTVQHRVYLNAFGVVVGTLGGRLKPYVNSIISTVLYRLKNKLPEVREQAASLIVRIAPVIKKCLEGDDEVLLKLILILYELLGEVYPEVLAALLNALYACIDAVDAMSLYAMQNPSVNQLLPTLTPILKNRQEKVQESSVRLVGLIARKNSETINAKEWMRICFELLDMLKSTKKRIRIAANDTFGYIAKTIGPQDVLAMLLNNLRVQERQLRVCTAVAIGIVAENCAPFTVLPALMNEYRFPEKNVQNGVLKALSFLFEYIGGEMTKDYLYAITPLLEDALTDRDQVHRQTAASVIKHMALNCIGLTNDGYYEVFVHYLNLLMPNVFETSPHVILRVLESVDAVRLVVGNGTFANYLWAGLFHPAQKVRSPYWKLYNLAYVQNADALVPYYPKVGLDGGTHIDELDIFL